MIGLSVKINCEGLKDLQKHIDFLSFMTTLKDNDVFRKKMEEKCLETIKKVARFQFANKTTTNSELYDDYLNSIHISEETDNGFVISSNLEVEKPTTDISIGYMFNVSMAFEYGTGIVGIGSAEAPSDYLYNVNKHKVIANNELLDGWWISREKNGSNPYTYESKSGKAVVTQGYEGMEIFRFSAVEINANIEKWIKDYIREYGGVSL